MHAHCFQHVPFEGLGSIEPWLAQAGHELTRTRFDQGQPLPQLDDIDLLIVMGGPMSVNDEDSLDWLAAEKRFIRAAIEAGKAVLGICLGAQLIASAMGASVHPGKEKEIGWFPITATSTRDGQFRFPPSATVFHWHGDTFDLPDGATLLAESAACKHQAFQLGNRVIGLQCHLETTAESARSMVHNCADELVPAPFVQSAQQILADGDRHYADINTLMGDVLAYLTRPVA